MGKNELFVGKNVNLERLATRIETYLQENKFEMGLSKDQNSSIYLIQARKSGILRTVSGSRRSTDIKITGKPDNFEVDVGTGEWGKNLVSSAPLFIIPILGIAATITKLYTAKKFESNLWNFVRDQVSFLKDTALSQVAGKETGTSMEEVDKEFSCEYIEGYPQWDNELDGKLVLKRNKSKENMLLFKTNSQEIRIPATSVLSTSIVSKKKGLNENDLMIQIEFKDASGKKIKPIFNLSDDIIRGILAGIDELIVEEKIHKKRI